MRENTGTHLESAEGNDPEPNVANGPAYGEEIPLMEDVEPVSVAEEVTEEST